MDDKITRLMAIFEVNVNKASKQYLTNLTSDSVNKFFQIDFMKWLDGKIDSMGG